MPDQANGTIVVVARFHDIRSKGHVHCDGIHVLVGGMNNKARVDDWRIRIAYPFFLVLDAVLKIEIIAARLFNSFRTAENVRQVLKSVYINSDAVDDELVDIICKPADDPNTLAVLVSVVTGPPGPKPEDLMDELDLPVLVLWGDSDVLTPVDVRTDILLCVRVVCSASLFVGDRVSG